ncbi:MAG: F0F1 ATP synthase subunit B [Bacteroidales bacterium]|nr:F0F1 ATP synthase subunit B [Bacteroidales bacterium]HOY39698.1 F0F1 ATP synthase subunit B [Bacteroidales bacterium]HQP04604.1 F0F1 ATP synthase subunit B [Bacteroidales bacterium]
MDLITPGIGLLFWMSISFILLVLILAKFAWKPILTSINKRNQSIEDALMSAEKAREEMASLKSENEKILLQAKAQREEILKEARIFGEKIIADAKTSAKTDIDKMKEQARLEITSEKTAALSQIKNQVAEISIQIAEKLLRKNLEEKERQEQLIEDILKEVNLN